MFGAHVENNLELIVIGDLSASSQIHNYLLYINQNSANFRSSHDVEYTTREYLIENKKFKVCLTHFLTDVKSNDGKEDKSDYQTIGKPYLANKNLSVVVCFENKESINNANVDQAEIKLPPQTLKKLNELIKNISNIRRNRSFNIIFVTIDESKLTKSDTSNYENSIKEKYTQLYIKHITTNKSDLANPNLLKKILNISMATSVYNEINNCVALLNDLKSISFQEEINNNQITDTKVVVIDEIKNIQNILLEALKPIGEEHTYTKDSLTAYINNNLTSLINSLLEIKNKLDESGDPQETYKINKFLNVLCSITAVVAFLTIVGIPFVCHALSKNMKYYNDGFKFFATNDIDKSRADVVNIEDKLNELAQQF